MLWDMGHAGALPSAVVKRLKLLVYCLAELSAQGVTGIPHQEAMHGNASRPASAAGYAFQRAVLAELPSSVAQPGQDVRLHLASYGPPVNIGLFVVNTLQLVVPRSIGR